MRIINQNNIEIDVDIDDRGVIRLSLTHPKLGVINRQEAIYDQFRRAFCWQVGNKQTAGVTFLDKDAQAFLKMAKEKEEEWLEKTIPGLRKLEAAREDVNRYFEQFSEMMEDENNDGVRPPKPIDINLVKVLEEKYPIATAYLKAESYEYSSWYVKSGAGRTAKEKLLNEENYIIVMADMEKEVEAGIDYNN